MGWWALILAFVLYLIVSVDLLIKKNYPLSIIFFCYAITNIAYLWLAYYQEVKQ